MKRVMVWMEKDDTVKELEMRKINYGVFGMTILLGTLFALGGMNAALAEVQVNINIGPPPIVVAEPPEVVFIPRSQVYFVPHPEIDIFFYNGYWWSPRGDGWYRAKAYNGPWRVVDKRHVPAPVHQVPRNYRNLYEKEKHIPYGQWKKQGKHQGENERHEERHEDNQRGRGHGHGDN